MVDTAAPPSVAEVQALQPFQGLWNGLVVGEGTDYPITGSLEGLFSYEARLGDAPVPGGDGDMPFSRYASSKFVVIPMKVVGPPLSDDLETNLEAFQEAFAADDSMGQEWFVFRTWNRYHMVRARVARRRDPLDANSYKTGVIDAVVELKLADPRLYDALARNTANLPNGVGSGGGFDLAADLPIEMAATSGGTASAYNSGTAIAWPVLRVSNMGGADITQIVVTNTTAGIEFDLVTNVAPGQTLVADFSALERRAPGPHIHIDGASRYGDWQHPRTPLPVLKGSNIFTADVTGGDPTIRLDWYNTSL